MAREYGKTFGTSYNHPGLRALPEDARNLFRYLCTATHSNAIGCYRVPIEYVCHDLQWGIERVQEGFRNLYLKPFATYDEANQMAFIPGWWNQNPIENRNVAKHVCDLVRALPDCVVKRHAIHGLARYAAGLPDTLGKGQPNEAKRMLFEAFGNPIETVSETLPQPFRTIEPEPEPEPSGRRLEETPKVVGISEQPPAEKTPLAIVSTNDPSFSAMSGDETPAFLRRA